MLVTFSPIFVVDTKIIYGYNFVAPLKKDKMVAEPLGVQIEQTTILT